MNPVRNFYTLFSIGAKVRRLLISNGVNIKTYNVIMILATLLAWLGFFIIINNFDPYQGQLVVFTLFYFVLFLAVLGTFSLFGFWLRKLWNRKRGIARIMVGESFRQAIIFSLALVIALILQANRLLSWWNIVLLVVIATIVEFMILVFRHDESKQLDN
jgi:Ca2+/Na+ antiporter